MQKFTHLLKFLSWFLLSFNLVSFYFFGGHCITRIPLSMLFRWIIKIFKVHIVILPYLLKWLAVFCYPYALCKSSKVALGNCCGLPGHLLYPTAAYTGQWWLLLPLVHWTRHTWSPKFTFRQLWQLGRYELHAQPFVKINDESFLVHSECMYVLVA